MEEGRFASIVKFLLLAGARVDGEGSHLLMVGFYALWEQCIKLIFDGKLHDIEQVLHRQQLLVPLNLQPRTIASGSLVL